MEEEVYRKLLLDLDKVLLNFQNFGKLPAEEVKRCFTQLTEISNVFISNLLGAQSTIDADYFVLKTIMEKEDFNNLSDIYFTVSSIANKGFTKLSRDSVKIRSWKNTEVIDKRFSIEIAKKLKGVMRSTWKNSKVS
jgi:hypothetical protein